LDKYASDVISDVDKREALMLSLFGYEYKSKEKGWSKQYYVTSPSKDEGGESIPGQLKGIYNRYFSLINSIETKEVVRSGDKEVDKQQRKYNREADHALVKLAESGHFEVKMKCKE
jgi:hypothetical protein